MWLLTDKFKIDATKKQEIYNIVVEKEHRSFLSSYSYITIKYKYKSFAMEKIQSLEWLAAKQYAALLVLNLVPEHIPHLSTLALSIKKKLVFYLQNSISISPEPYHQPILEQLVVNTDIEVSLDLVDNGNINNKMVWSNILKKCKRKQEINNDNNKSTCNNNNEKNNNYLINLKELKCKCWKNSLSSYLQGLSTLKHINISGYKYENADQTMFVSRITLPFFCH